MEKRFSEVELDLINDYLFSVLKKEGDRITIPNAYQALKNKFSDWPENVFVPSLNKTIKDNKFPGLVIVRGRYGGIRLGGGSVDNSEPIVKESVSENKNHGNTLQGWVDIIDESSKKEEVLEALPIPNEPNEELYQKVREMVSPPTFTKPKISLTPKPAKISLWLKDQRYDVPHSFNEIQTLLTEVLEVKEDPNGPIKFNDRCYSCSEMALGFLDKFLFFFYGASLVIEHVA